MARFARVRWLALAAVLAIGCAREPDAATRADTVAFDLDAARAKQ